MTKYVGYKVKAYVAALDQTGAPLLIAGQRDCDYTVEMDSIDVSSKDSTGNWNEVIAGQRNWSVSISGAHVLGDESHDILENAVIEPEHTHETGQVMVFMETEGGLVRHGQALVTSFAITAPHTDLASYDIALDGNGAVQTAETLPAAFEKVFGAGTFAPAMMKAGKEYDKVTEKAEKKIKK